MTNIFRLPLAVWIAFLVVVLDMLGLGLIWPVLPQLLGELTGQAAEATARWAGALMVAYAAAQFVFGTIMGNLSDRFGRRPVLLLALACLAFNYFLMACAASIWLLFIGRLASGAAGATMSVAYAIVADATKHEQRATAMGLVSAAFGLGFSMGPALGGLLAIWGTRMPFVAATVAVAAAMIFAAIFFRESLPESERRSISWRRANPLGALLRIMEHRGLAALFGVFFLMNTAGEVYPSIWNYFVRVAFDWGPVMIGLSLAFVGLTSAFAQVVLTGRFSAWLGDYGAALMTMAISGAAMLGIGLLPLAPGLHLLIWPLMLATTVGGVAHPALQSLLSKTRSASEQGELQGILASLMALSSIITPLAATYIFHASSVVRAQGPIPGMVFFFSSAVEVAAIVLLVFGVSRALIAQATENASSRQT